MGQNIWPVNYSLLWCKRWKIEWRFKVLFFFQAPHVIMLHTENQGVSASTQLLVCSQTPGQVCLLPPWNMITGFSHLFRGWSFHSYAQELLQYCGLDVKHYLIALNVIGCVNVCLCLFILSCQLSLNVTGPVWQASLRAALWIPMLHSVLVLLCLLVLYCMWQVTPTVNVSMVMEVNREPASVHLHCWKCWAMSPFHLVLALKKLHSKRCFENVCIHLHLDATFKCVHILIIMYMLLVSFRLDTTNTFISSNTDHKEGSVSIFLSAFHFNISLNI